MWFVVVLVLTSIKASVSQNLQNQSASIPPFITQEITSPNCPAQQQQKAALHEFQTLIASKLAAITQCGGDNWTEVAYLNMGDPMQSCPQNWTNRTANGIRVCGRPADSAQKCHSTFYPSDGRSYIRVCGQVIGYQFGYPDAFMKSVVNSTYTIIPNINEDYVDGVSVTHGSPQTHIWTFAADGSEGYQVCPCEGGQSAPPFVGENYYCESGYNGTSRPSKILYTSDPLWDGLQCESEGSCCSTAPWFTVDLVNSTSDDIEVRICANYAEYWEDTPIHFLQIFIQ